MIFQPVLWTFHLLWLCRAYRNNTLKHSSLYEAFLPFLSPVLLFILSTSWVVYSPSNILELQPRIFYLMVGTAFANVTVSVCWFFFLNVFPHIPFFVLLTNTFKTYIFVLICFCMYLSCSVSWLCVRWVTHVVKHWVGCCCLCRWWCC